MTRYKENNVATWREGTDISKDVLQIFLKYKKILNSLRRRTTDEYRDIHHGGWLNINSAYVFAKMLHGKYQHISYLNWNGWEEWQGNKDFFTVVTWDKLAWEWLYNDHVEKN